MNRRYQLLERAALGLMAAAFAILAAVIWLDELFDLPHLLFHAPPTPFRWQESAFESGILLTVAILTTRIVHSLYRRLTEALAYLPICPACQRVETHGRWTSISDFLQSEQGESMDYTLCPTCSPPAIGSTTPLNSAA